MRKTRHDKLKGQRQILLVGLFVFVTLMTIGYAAFNTNITLHVKGNIKTPPVDMAGVDVTPVTEGDGLYEDEYEEGRYVYKGTDPDNYIMFNNELWRIISKEADGTYKILRNQQDIVHKEMHHSLDVMHGVQLQIWSEVRVNLQMEHILELSMRIVKC